MIIKRERKCDILKKQTKRNQLERDSEKVTKGDSK